MNPVELLLSVVAISAPISGQDWSAAQKEVVTKLHDYTRGCVGGDVAKIMGYLHRDFSMWNYAEEKPTDYAGAKKFNEDFFGAHHTLLSFDVEPMIVKITGNNAVVHMNYRESIKLADGKQILDAGRWTATLQKSGSGWLFMSR